MGFPRKLGDSEGRVFSQAPRDAADPGCTLARRLPLRFFQKPANRGAQPPLGDLSCAGLSEFSRLPSRPTANPLSDGPVGKPSETDPGGIELDLDLLEPESGDGVAVRRAGAIKDRGRTANELCSDFCLVQISPHHE